jgi:hypothetical protein
MRRTSYHHFKNIVLNSPPPVVDMPLRTELFCVRYARAMLINKLSGALLFSYILGTQICAASETMVLPSLAEHYEGDNSSQYPLGTGEIRIEQVFGSSMFPSLSPAGQAFQLGQLSLRFNTLSQPGSETASFNRVQIFLSTGTLFGNNNIDQNHGADKTLVFDGQITLSGSETPPGPSDFDLHFPFSNSFNYDPAAGSLVLEIRKYGSDRFNSFQLDAQSNPQMRFLVSTLDHPNGQQFGPIGLVSEFTYSGVPEPQTFTILICGMLLLYKPLVNKLQK